MVVIILADFFANQSQNSSGLLKDSIGDVQCSILLRSFRRMCAGPHLYISCSSQSLGPPKIFSRLRWRVRKMKPNAPIITGTTEVFVFHVLLNQISRFRYLKCFSVSHSSCPMAQQRR